MTEITLVTLTDLARLTRGPKKLRPCLYADTGAGKSGRVDALAAELKLPLERLLLHTSLPEDLWGFQRVAAGRTQWVLPDWAHRAAESPHVILLDELDKPHPDGMAAALTFIWELRVRHVVLHPDTVVMAAMQPVDSAAWLAETTTQALSARLLFLPVRDDWKYVEASTGLDLSDFPARDVAAPPVYPRPVPRTVEQAVGLAAGLLQQDYSPTRVTELLGGTLPKEFAAAVVERLQKGGQAGKLSVRGVVAALKSDPELVERLSLSELSTLCPDIIHHLPPGVYKRTLERLCIEGTPELVHATFEAQYNELVRRIEAEPSKEIDVFDGATNEQVTAELLEAFKTIGTEYKRRGEEKQGGWKGKK